MSSIRLANRDDMLAIRTLLSDSGLSIQDIARGAITFLVAHDETTLAGVAGLEQFGDAALLRSVAVRTEARSTGLGVRLVEEIEAYARGRGVTRLVLLTQTAPGFFSKRGYLKIERTTAPDDVRQSTEFTLVCPASAICMLKSLSTAK
ncbi:MAG: arsenic resistance N-acetyltransferase ArsN2 [Tahibacter sp.]